jgi:transposase
MIHLPASVRVYLCLTPCDMRKSFDSLQTLVREHLELDAFAGHLFVFTSRRKDRVKILYWDRDGFAVWSKRLEEGTYAVPFGDDGAERPCRQKSYDFTDAEILGEHPKPAIHDHLKTGHI